MLHMGRRREFHFIAQALTRAGEPRHYCTNRNLQFFCDLPVVKSLKADQQEHLPML
jgi:hypothetical protein